MKILYAKMTSNSQVFHPSTGRLEGTIVDERYRGIQMKLTGNGVKIIHKGKSLLVPLHMFDFVELEEESDVKEAPKQDKKRLF
jgi:hypothetical protein